MNVKISPHDLRRHSATYASRNGVPLEIIYKVILRHQDLKTSQIYLGKISDTERPSGGWTFCMGNRNRAWQLNARVCSAKAKPIFFGGVYLFSCVSVVDECLYQLFKPWKIRLPRLS